MSFTERQMKDHIYGSQEIAGMYRFAMRIGFWNSEPDRSSMLEKFLKVANVASLSEIDGLLSARKPLIEKFLLNLYANRVCPWRVTPEFICELVLIVEYPEVFTKEQLVEELQWDSEATDRILKALHETILVS